MSVTEKLASTRAKLKALNKAFQKADRRFRGPDFKPKAGDSPRVVAFKKSNTYGAKADAEIAEDRIKALLHGKRAGKEIAKLKSLKGRIKSIEADNAARVASGKQPKTRQLKQLKKAQKKRLDSINHNLHMGMHHKNRARNLKKPGTRKLFAKDLHERITAGKAGWRDTPEYLTHKKVTRTHKSSSGFPRIHPFTNRPSMFRSEQQFQTIGGEKMFNWKRDVPGDAAMKALSKAKKRKIMTKLRELT